MAHREQDRLTVAAINGRLPASLRGTIPGTTREVRLDLVPQIDALRGAFAAKFGRPLVVTDAYRSYDEQVAVFLRYYTTKPQAGQPIRQWEGKTYWQRPGYPSAAVPGTSNHGLAVALDLGSGVNTSLTSPEHLWMRANGGRYGLTHPSWAHDHVDSNGTDEPWHFEAIYVTPQNYAPTEEPDMDANQAAQLDFIFNAIKVPGTSYGWLQPINDKVDGIGATLADSGTVGARVKETRDRVRGTEPAGDMLQMIRADIAALDTGGAASLSDADLARIADAVQDEQDKRERERLGEGL